MNRLITFWGGKLDGVVIDLDDNSKSDWQLFQLLQMMYEEEDHTGAMYYYGEHYIVRECNGSTAAMHQSSGELFDMLQEIKRNDFPDHFAYFF